TKGAGAVESMTRQYRVKLVGQNEPTSITTGLCFQRYAATMRLPIQSRGLPYHHRKFQQLSAFVWRQPLCNLAKALRNIELDYLCHTSSDTLLGHGATEEGARRLPKHFLGVAAISCSRVT